MNITTRLATIEDASEIASLLNKSVTSLCAEKYSNEQIKTVVNYFNEDFYLEGITNNYRIIYVAEADEKIVGFGSISEDGRAVCDIFVLPNYTRQGIATLLLGKLEQIALGKGVSKLWAMASLTSQPFYAACGFNYEKDCALIDAETGIKFPCVDMTKVMSRNKNFQGENQGDRADLSTLTVPQFVKLGIKILLGSPQ